jgi:antitoxin VapB
MGMANPKALNIKNAETVDLARAVAAKTGESLTEAVTNALRERLAAVSRESDRAVLRSSVARIQDFVASLPERDSRTPDEILGYDDFGLPG